MSDLRRFPVSDEFILSWQTFCVILDRKEIFDFQLCVFHNWSRDHPRHGNVGNRLANRMEALSDSCGAGFRSKLPSEETESRFWPHRHLFAEFQEI